MKKEKTRCMGTMTEARYRAWVTSHLRSMSRKWPPKNMCLKIAKEEARRRIAEEPDKYPEMLTKAGKPKTGYFVCEICDTIQNIEKGKNIAADHIEPIVDPIEGFQGWDQWIERALVETDGFQCLCKDCHDKKSKAENELRREHKND